MTAQRKIVGAKAPEEAEPLCKTIPEFARYIGRSESTVKRLIADGVIIALHDGRSVTIPVQKNTQLYLEYLKKRELEHRQQKRSKKTVAKRQEHPKVYSELGERVMAMGDFIVDDAKSKTDPERSSTQTE